MRYVIASKWSRLQQFTITDASGAPAFSVQRQPRMRRRLSIRDQTGRELAALTRRGLSTKYEIAAGGGPPVQVRHQGVFGQRYLIDSPSGPITAEGGFTGRSYELSRGGQPVATVTRERTLREKFTVDIADGEDAVLVLAAVLAIDEIRDQRRRAAAGS